MKYGKVKKDETSETVLALIPHGTLRQYQILESQALGISTRRLFYKQTLPGILIAMLYWINKIDDHMMTCYHTVTYTHDSVVKDCHRISKQANNA
mmetsp:Transcript_18165/g.22322  ORF Transcript_18165/g.22322 Transcript_18165/m.22322 type:complete len:95 (-) Transcript_18165:176-460(-)